MKIKPNQKIQVLATAGDAPSEVIVSGDIGDWGLQGKELRNALDSIPKGKKINLRVNSQGGSVAQGLEMYHAIKSRSSDITAHVNGYAVSAASVFPLAANRVVSPKGSIWMIHCAACASYGNSDDKLKDAEMLDVHDDEMAGIYAAKTGKSKKAVMDAMKAETWMTSADAVEFGLADEAPDADEDPEMCAIDNLNFKNVPTSLRAKANKNAVLADGKLNKIMNKKKLVLFLKTKDIDASEDWTDEQFESALNKVGVTAEAKTTTDTVTVAELKELRARLDSERLSRVTALITARGANKIPNAGLQWWIKQALANETDTLAQIDAMPEHQIGGAQVGNSVSIGAENPVEKIVKAHPGRLKVAARYNEIKANWEELWADAQARDVRAGNFKRGDAQASNSYSAGLVTQILLDGATTTLQNRWAALKTFLRDYGTDRYKPLATAQLKYVTTTDGLVQVNATNFEQGDSAVTNVGIAVNQYTRSFHVTNSELNSGLRMENLLDINMAVFADKIIQVATAPITAENFPTAPIVRAPGNFGWGDMQTAWGLLKKSPIHNALLDGEYLAQIINVPTQFQKTGVEPGTAWAEFGWDNIALNTNWTGADLSARGFACNPQAIGAVAGLPLTPPNIPGGVFEEKTIFIPGPDITIAFYMWFSLQSRTFWTSFDMMFGAAAVDNTAGVIIKSS